MTAPAASNRRHLAWWAAMGVLLVAAGGWWALSEPSPDVSAAALVQGAKLPQTAPSAARLVAALAKDRRAASPITADSFLTDHLQQTFEDMLLEATANTESGELRAASCGMWLGCASAMRAALQARDRVRQQYFSAEEHEVLFAQDERLGRYTLARLGIERQTQLSAGQKQAALDVAAQGLSDSQRAERSAAAQHLGVQAQTAAFDSRNASATERHAQRSAQYGEPASSCLAQLDGQNASGATTWTSQHRPPQPCQPMPARPSASNWSRFASSLSRWSINCGSMRGWNCGR